jgi:hypothetical protein
MYNNKLFKDDLIQVVELWINKKWVLLLLIIITKISIHNQNINPRSCVYGCGIQIYWNTSVNEYWEVFTKKKHLCPNRENKSSGTTPTLGTDGITPPSNSPKPHYYNPYARKRTPYASFSGQQQPKPKMSNSFELLQDSIADVQIKWVFEWYQIWVFEWYRVRSKLRSSW